MRVKFAPVSTLLTAWVSELISERSWADSALAAASVPPYFSLLPDQIRSSEFCSPDWFRLIVFSNWLNVLPPIGSTIVFVQIEILLIPILLTLELKGKPA